MIKDTETFTADKKLQNTSEKETGKLRFTLKNDYLFKAVLQENRKALKELLAVLLHKKVSEIKDVRLENPIIPGETIDEKTVILDIRITLNNNEAVNIEMQVRRQDFWEERRNGLYDWAKFFAAKTWEELKMAAKSEAMESAVVTMRELTADDKIRLQCEARERYERDLLTWKSQIETAKAEAEKFREKSEKLEAESKKLASEKQTIYEVLKQNPTLSAEEILEKLQQ